MVVSGVWIQYRWHLEGQSRAQKAMERELDQLYLAFQAYKERWGYYPPAISDWSDPDLRRTLKVILARQDFSVDLDQLESTIRSTAGLEISDLDCAESLVFWLGGLPERRGAGFALPGRATGVGLPGIQSGTVFFNFDQSRLTDVDHDGWPEYRPLPGACDGLQPPFVYFDYRAYETGVYPSPARGNPAMQSWGVCVPYQLSPKNWANPDSFQIIITGCDLRYGGSSGSPRVLKTHAGITEADFDNLTNFCDGPLRTMIP